MEPDGSGGSAGSGGGGGGGGAGGLADDAGPNADGAVEAEGGNTGGAPAYGINGQSCGGGLTCGTQSCCASIDVPGGSFLRGSVHSFALDTFEVTVGRFRKFVNAYQGKAPPAGAGAHPLIAASGWNTNWDSALPTNKSDLSDSLDWGPPYGTWTASPGGNETKPINAVSWYLAFMFCAWDGGRLPTEAEWEYAAAGGNANNTYPWGNNEPDCTIANFHFCNDPKGTMAVGSLPLGIGRYGHLDLGGNVDEWVLDSYGDYPAGKCVDCASLSPGVERVLRGGYFIDPADDLRAIDRGYNTPDTQAASDGFRCARSVTGADAGSP